VAVLGFGSGHPTFGALMAVLFVAVLLRAGRTIIIGVPVATVPGGTTLRGRKESRGQAGATCASTAGDFIHKLAVIDR
jgi:hypothetical protein